MIYNGKEFVTFMTVLECFQLRIDFLSQFRIFSQLCFTDSFMAASIFSLGPKLNCNHWLADHQSPRSCGSLGWCVMVGCCRLSVMMTTEVCRCYRNSRKSRNIIVAVSGHHRGCARNDKLSSQRRKRKHMIAPQQKHVQINSNSMKLCC